MSTLPYRFFPAMMFVLIPILLLLKKDIGPINGYLLPAEQEGSDAGGSDVDVVFNMEGAAAEDMDGPLAPKPDVPHRAINALLPFGTIAIATFGGMLIDGAVKLRVKTLDAVLTLVGMLGESDSIAALIFIDLGWVVSMALVLSQGVLDLTEAMDAWIEGMKDVIAPMIVLLLAWSLGDVIGKAKAADFLARSLDSSLPKWSLPALVSVLAHVISYACGSSFGTMGIILPLVGPLARKIGGDDEQFLRHCIGSVLGGALGNICSPISDTTISPCCNQVRPQRTRCYDHALCAARRRSRPGPRLDPCGTRLIRPALRSVALDGSTCGDRGIQRRGLLAGGGAHHRATRDDRDD